ncbi:B-cell receptor-associated protein 31-like containing protein [Aphelenchoides avenae]|nr:B-cell receptor-associated protein 31-like containing protein [Aphelenchus avenae]
MTIQWVVISLILYIETAMSVILLLPWIRPKMWRRFFNSRIVTLIQRKGNVYINVALCILILLFADAVREIRNFDSATIDMGMKHAAGSDAVIHMRLFRAQRNLYISGFSLLLFFLNKRIIGLLYQSAHLEMAADEAVGGQPGGAWNLSQKKEEIDSLKKEVCMEREEKEKVMDEAEHLQHEFDRVNDLLREKQGDSELIRRTADRLGQQSADNRTRS